MKELNQLVEACHKVYEKGFVSAYDGNLSSRIDEDTILITRSGINKGEVTPNDILTIDNSGNLLSGKGKVSTEVKLHLNIYNSRSDVNSVIHCHPVFSTAISITHEKFPNNIFPEAILTLGNIPICKYEMPSTSDLADSLNPFLDFAYVFLLSNHGAVTVGNNISTAYYRMEKLEQISQIIISAKSVGEIKELPDSEIKKLYDIAEDTYSIKIDERNKVLKNE